MSVLDTDGTPTVVDRVFIKPPLSRLGAITAEERTRCINASTLVNKYSETIDRDSAFEKLTARAAQIEQEQAAEEESQPEKPAPARRTDSIFESVIKSTMRAAGSQLGRQLIRGVLGGLFGRRG